VKASLEAVPGVAKVVVSYQDKTAIVTFDDSKTDVKTLTDVTTSAGYPSAPKGCTHASPVRHHLSSLRHRKSGDDADRRLPVLL
jgi:cation transport ATPase